MFSSHSCTPLKGPDKALAPIFAMALLAFSIAVTYRHDRLMGAEGPGDWYDFLPNKLDTDQSSAIDLRFLNEPYAGSQGFIVAKAGQFLHSATETPVRFWGVNGPPEDLQEDELRDCARTLARYGVNLVRIHGKVFDANGNTDMAQIRKFQTIVRAMKSEGIYTHLSIYFPLWFDPAADLSWLPGYDGKTHPFATLMFSAEFQQRQHQWFHDLLTTPDPISATMLRDEPAVMGIEIQNEDSFFFWTFNEKNIPNQQLQILEAQFAEWVKAKYGTLEKGLSTWGGAELPRDAIQARRLAFRPLWNMANERTERDIDTANFLLEKQQQFYSESIAYLRTLGFQGLICASNWATASPERFGPLEKLSYLTADFVDRHGYFSCNHAGDNAAWSIRESHTFSHRSALRFDGSTQKEKKEFVHPVMDPQYNNAPSMISETTFTRPNRYRSEAPLYYSVFGALQDSDAIIHFALDGDQWQVKPRYWTQPWTISTPAMMGQFPAAALIFRKSLVDTGPVVVEAHLNLENIKALRGTPLPQDAAFDELRQQDVPQGKSTIVDQRIDPLVHYVGRTQITFTDGDDRIEKIELSSFIDRSSQRVISATHEIELDYGRGLLRLDAPKVQGVSGDMSAAKEVKLSHLTIESSMDLIHIVAVSLDDQPLELASKILLQVMTEERPSGFTTEPAGSNSERIVHLGNDPWQVRRISGAIRLRYKSAKNLTVVALNPNGSKQNTRQTLGTDERFQLLPETNYYLIERN